jgi:hypothetical protein
VYGYVAMRLRQMGTDIAVAYSQMQRELVIYFLLKIFYLFFVCFKKNICVNIGVKREGEAKA